MGRVACHVIMLIPCVISLALAFTAWSERRDKVGKAPWVTSEREVFHGIAARVEFEVPRGADPATLLDAAWAEFDVVSRVANAFDPTSEVGRLNTTFKVGACEVSKELFDILEISIWANRVSEGAFDATIWPLKVLWREAAIRGRWPDPEDVSYALERVGLFRVHLSPGGTQVTFDAPDAALDLGGVAKGWAVDRVASLLESSGVRSYLVQCGGEVAALGRSPSKGPWTIGVSHPFEPEKAIGVIVGPERLSVSTCGPAAQPLLVGDRLVHHVLDPRSGTPAPLSVASVTVVIQGTKPSTARADALSTALCVLGPQRGLEVLSKVPGADALFLVPGPQGTLAEVRSPGISRIYRVRE